MDRKFLYEIEVKYGQFLESWDRNHAKENPAQLVMPYTPIPKENVIQGLFRSGDVKAYLMLKRKVAGAFFDSDEALETSINTPVENRFKREKRLDAAKLGKCFKCDFLDKVSGRCLLKRVKGEGACIKAKLEVNPSVRRTKFQSELCAYCDYALLINKRNGVCPFQKVHGACRFERKRNGKENVELAVDMPLQPTP